MNKNLESFRTLVTGIYSWVVTIFFGIVLLDMAYANLLKDVLSTSQRIAILGEVSDLLLLIYGLGVLAGIGAVLLSLPIQLARNFLLLSLVMVLFELLVPVFFTHLIENTQNPYLGTWLRVSLSGMASQFAFAALLSNQRRK
jgi:hypothetical protein